MKTEARTILEAIAANGRHAKAAGISSKFFERLETGTLTRAEICSAVRLTLPSDPDAYFAALDAVLGEPPWSVNFEVELAAAEKLLSVLDAAQAVKLRTVDDIFAYSDPEPLIEGLIFKNTVTMLSGWTGDGKTIAAHEIERSCCGGFPVFGNSAFKVHGPGMVILFDEETPAPMLKDRLQRMGFRSDLPFRVGHFTGLRLDDEKDFEIIRALVDVHRPVLVVFDSLIRFHTREENDASGMAPIMGRLRQLANMTTVLVIHHVVKAEVDIRKRSRGSGDIIGGADLELSLAKTAEGDILIQSAKSRGRPVDPFLLRIEDTPDGRLVVAYKGIDRPPAERLGDAVVEAIAGAPLAFAEIEAALTEKGISASKRSLQRAIAALGAQNAIRVLVGTRGKKTYSLDSTCAGAHEVRK